MGDIKFDVNPEKRRVICFLYNCENIALNRIKKYVPCFNTEIFAKKYKLKIDPVYVGIAKCAPEDEFDVEYGKKLALTRAKQKRCKAINRVIYDVFDVIDCELNNLDRYGIHIIPSVSVR